MKDTLDYARSLARKNRRNKIRMSAKERLFKNQLEMAKQRKIDSDLLRLGRETMRKCKCGCFEKDLK